MSEIPGKGGERQFDPVAQTALYHAYGIGMVKAPRRRQRREDSPSTFDPEVQRAYPFTTENMAAYIGDLDLEGADIVAVCGSGDFAFNAFMEGAHSVDCVDVMPTACFYAELKLAGLKTLGRDGFIRFFAGEDRRSRYGFAAYQALRDHLSEQSRGYFDQLITPRGQAPYLVRGLLIEKIKDITRNIAMNPYLASDEVYELAARNAGDVSFHPTSLTNFLTDTRSTSYDVIYLSNILAYFPIEAISGEVQKLFSLAQQRLRPGGRIVEFSFALNDYKAEAIMHGQRRLADKNGLCIYHTLVTAPHAAEDSGYMGVVAVFESS